MFSIAVPNKPKNLRVISTSKTWISLKWDVPDKSEGVTILYNVTYETKFWGESMTVPNVKATNVTLENLRPGTTYDFTVNVFAGNRSSESVLIEGKTGRYCSLCSRCNNCISTTIMSLFQRHTQLLNVNIL